MRIDGLKTALTVVGLVAALAMATNVFAGRGPGGDGRGRDCPGYGPGMGLSDEEAAGFQGEREAFFAATADLRRSIRQKDLELQSELAKDQVDGAKAIGIQKALSALESQLDEKRLEHRIKMHSAYPDWQGGPGRGGRGMGCRGGCR